MKKVFMQALDFDRSVSMIAICFSDLISAVPTNEQRHSEQIRLIDILKTEGLVCVYTDGQR